MCRQAKKNALTHAMYAQLAAALADANQDDQVRVVVIAGEGGVFTAGNDLRDFMEHPPTGEDSPVFQVIRQLIYADKPLVAAVEGPAVGIGTTMLLHCDYVAVSESARFSMPFTALGLTAEAGASLLLPQRCGMARASELLLLGDRFDAAAAKELGIANVVTEAGEAESAARAFAVALAARPPGAVQATKRLLREPIRAALEPVILDESTTFVQRLGSPGRARPLRPSSRGRRSRRIRASHSLRGARGVPARAAKTKKGGPAEPPFERTGSLTCRRRLPPRHSRRR